MAYIKKDSCKPPILIERRSSIFGRPYLPGQEAPCRGIYRCICGYEILHQANKELPLCDDHSFSFPVAWKLIVSIDDIPEIID